MPVAIADHAKPLRLLAIDDNSLPVLRQTFHRQGYGERRSSSGRKSIFPKRLPSHTYRGENSIECSKDKFI